MKLVVDASVIVAMMFQGPSSVEAGALLSRSAGDVLAPDLIVLETLSSIWKKYRAGLIDGAEAASAIPLADRLPVRLVSAALLEEATLALSFELDHSPYDCAYLALALFEQAQLLTTDRRLAQKAEQAGYGEYVRLLQ